ncbi:hypothetical protein ABEB36_010499 [Hypothenemus hampei]|uniref:Uncharacterized protein n=1 Tax=Hypothenemus hampei TaxID=57062 RepID=A0ABD1EJY6_HYPHA
MESRYNFRFSFFQLGGGIWGGMLAMITGISGILSAAKHVCPFKHNAQKAAHTTFLALSLISVAVSQLIVVIACTGLARDVNSVEFRESLEKPETLSTLGKLTEEIAENYKGILFNIILIIVSSFECITAGIASYRSARELCPCFRKSEEYYQDNLNAHRSHALVSSWLMDKHGLSNSAVPQIYLVAPSSTLERGSKMSSVMPVPLYAIPAPLIQPPIMGYPLIPAPLGSIPSPIIPPQNRKHTKVYKYYMSRSRSRSRSREPTPRKSKSKSYEPQQMTEADLVRTYTGLDRAMAEEFIDICEMKNASLCSDLSSCNNSTCQSPCSSSADGCHTNSDANSHDCLVKK